MKWIVGTAAAVLVAGWVAWRFTGVQQERSVAASAAESTELQTTGPSNAGADPREAFRRAKPGPTAPPVEAAGSGSEADEGAGFEVDRGRLEAWLQSKGNDPVALLAAARLTDDPTYRERALQLHPRDPAVLVDALSRTNAAGSARDHLETLKQVAPSNAVGFYLSAARHLREGQREEAMADLTRATGLGEFDDFARAAFQRAAEFLEATGEHSMAARSQAFNVVNLATLAEFKQLAIELRSAATDATQRGDTADADVLTAVGVQLGRRLNSDAGFMMHQMVGSAVEMIALRGLPAESHPEFLGMSVGEYQAAEKVRREEIKEAAGYLSHWLPTATDEDQRRYFEAVLRDGEVAALKRLRAGGP